MSTETHVFSHNHDVVPGLRVVQRARAQTRRSGIRAESAAAAAHNQHSKQSAVHLSQNVKHSYRSDHLNNKLHRPFSVSHCLW